MPRRITYWGATGLVGIVTLLAGFSYLTSRPRGGREFPAHGISPAVAYPARHREAGRSHRAAPATAADIEGMGLRRLYLHVDRGDRGALSGSRRHLSLLPVALIGISGGCSYVTRPANRRGPAKPMLA